MGKRDDIRSILVIGSGPIVIGQACEFDYSGTQAVRALKREGYRVVLVNSNPATIMTDPELADATYVEPLTPEFLERIVEKERPDAILPTVGGQTAINLALALAEKGVLERRNVVLIGANERAMRLAEDRDLFKKAMLEIGAEVPRSERVRSLAEAEAALKEIGLPVVIRPSFTLGGSGGGAAKTLEEFRRIVRHGLAESPSREVLIEESVEGWKEFELEVMRDTADNVIIVCSIENFDAMGVHTGDSITVAPQMTLSDRQYQAMRDEAKAIIRKVGVDTGGSNIQFAVDPKSGRRVVIEMNPRVSRSSALASKATGFPIAKIAALLAVGYHLDEIPNDITKKTPASFEPSLDYVVVKIPRWTFEKFPRADNRLTIQMKSVGEAMAIGRTFPEALGKAIRSLEIGRDGLDDGRGELPRAELLARLEEPTPERLFHLRRAFLAGMTVEQVAKHTRIDPWFLDGVRRMVETEESFAGVSLETLDRERLRAAKRLGLSDRALARRMGREEGELLARRRELGVIPVYKTIDTCAAEFEAQTPYFYSTYEDENESIRTDRPKVAILGGGPNRIGQGIEFDYCCVHACYALAEAGFETIMINCNPETVSTDYDTSDRLYFEPLTLEDVSAVLDNEKPDGILVQFGGQTPLKLARPLEAAGYPIWGTSPESIDLAEDRGRFGRLLGELGLAAPPHAEARTEEEALAAARRIGYPLVVRPSYVLGGRAMAVVFEDARLTAYMKQAVASSPEHPGPDRPLPRRRRRARRGRALRRAELLDRRHPAAHRGGRHPLRRLVLRAPALEDPGAASRRDPAGHAPARGGPHRARPRQHPVRHPARPSLRARGQPARLPHGAVRVEGHRRPDGARGGAADDPGADPRIPESAAGARPGRLLHQGAGVPVPQVPRRRRPARPGDEVDRRSHGHLAPLRRRVREGLRGGRHPSAAFGPGVSDGQSVRQGGGDPDRPGASGPRVRALCDGGDARGPPGGGSRGGARVQGERGQPERRRPHGGRGHPARREHAPRKRVALRRGRHPGGGAAPLDPLPDDALGRDRGRRGHPGVAGGGDRSRFAAGVSPGVTRVSARRCRRVMGAS